MGRIHTHRGTKTSIDLENGQLAKGGRVLGLREGAVRHDLVIAGRFDAIPVPGRKVSKLDCRSDGESGGLTIREPERVLKDSG
jgi:hypothetical protein